MLSGCAAISADPFDWWNHLEGGAIARQRPPPPGATDPYQPVELMPPRPPPIDPAARLRIANSLATDQATAERIGVADPLSAKSPPTTADSPPPLTTHPPTLPRPPSQPPADGNAANATIQAVEAPASPASPSPASPSPASPAPASPSPAPAASSAPRNAGRDVTTAPAGPLPPLAELALPAIPTGPPPRPNNLPEEFSVPRSAPEIAGLVTPLVPNVSQPVTFRTGQATLTAAAAAALRALVAARAGKTVEIIGRGEAASFDLAVQTKALQLAVARAQAISDVLRRAGLPPSAMRIQAEPFGRGGAAILLS